MILKKDSTGGKVKMLQTKLGIEPTGVFGSKTEESVKKWQKQNGLKDDGIVGKVTWEKMFPGELIKEDVVIPTVGALKLEKLKGHIPESVISQIPDTAKKFNITTPLRLAHFLAQCGHESGGFKAIQENLNYSADGLKKIFPKYFPGNLSESYARNPEKIASKVYGGRMGNGDEASGDGWRYRGRGLIQTTGKANYVKLAQYIKKTLEETIEYCETVEGAVESACFYWTSNNLNAIADTGDMAALTRRINGGVIGLADRLDKYKKTLEALEKSNAKVG